MSLFPPKRLLSAKIASMSLFQFCPLEMVQFGDPHNVKGNEFKKNSCIRGINILLPICSDKVFNVSSLQTRDPQILSLSLDVGLA